jgi:hypothetical protein
MPGRFDALMNLFFDHRTNVALYQEFQKFIRESKVCNLAFVRAHFVFISLLCASGAIDCFLGFEGSCICSRRR